MRNFIITILFWVLAAHYAVAQNVHKETINFNKSEFSFSYDHNGSHSKCSKRRKLHGDRLVACERWSEHRFTLC